MKRGVGVLLATLLISATACGSDDNAADSTTAATAGTPETTAESGGADPPDTTEAGTTSPPSTSGPATGEPIEIAGIFNLTGPAAATGVTEANGVQLAIEQINAAGGVDGRPIELAVGDAESNPDTAVKLTRDFVRDGYQAIVGPTLASQCQAAREISEAAGVTLYCLSPIPPQSDLVFNIEYSPISILSAIPAKFMAEQGWTRVACLHAADVSGQAYLSTLEAMAPAFGLEIVAVESFQPGDVDVAAQLTNIRAADPDVVMSCASGGDHPTVLRGMQQLGMDLPVVLGFGGLSYEVLDLAADFLPESGAFSAGSTVLVADQLPEDFPGRDGAIVFRDEYEAKFGVLPSHNAGIAFDAMLVLGEALKSSPEDGAAIADALEQVCDFQGVLTTYCLSPEDHSGFQLVTPMIVRWAEDRFDLESILDPEGIPGRTPPED